MLEQKENSSNKTDPINLRRRQVPGLLHVQQRCTRSRNDTGRKKVMTLRKSHLKPDPQVQICTDQVIRSIQMERNRNWVGYNNKDILLLICFWSCKEKDRSKH